MKRFLFLILALLVVCRSLFAEPKLLRQREPFFATVSGSFDSTDETLIACIPVGDVWMMSVKCSIETTDDLSLTGDLKIMGADTKLPSLTNAYTVDSHASLQSWTTTGAQSSVRIEGIEPCSYLCLTSTASTGATTPGTVTITIRGHKFGKGGEQPW